MNIWKLKFNELQEHTTQLFLWIQHNNDISEGRRKYDAFVGVKKRQFDELIASLPKGEHEQLN